MIYRPHTDINIYFCYYFVMVYLIVAEKASRETRSIKVSALPAISVNEDFITDFFENQKNGGGDVAEVDYDPGKNIAIVKFEDSRGNNS